jgi:hypothetical protein
MGNNISATAEEPIRNKINNKKYIDINNVVIDEKLKVINLGYSNGVVVRYARDGRKLDDGRTVSPEIPFENPINKIKDFIGNNADDPSLNIEVSLLDTYETKDGKYLFYYTDGSFVSVKDRAIIVDTRNPKRKYQSIRTALVYNYSELLDVTTDRFYTKPELTDSQKLAEYNRKYSNLPQDLLMGYSSNNSKRINRLADYYNNNPFRFYDPSNYVNDYESYKDSFKKRQR